jgi:predicted enzyme related to lactoylglutathione lyase
MPAFEKKKFGTALRGMVRERLKFAFEKTCGFYVERAKRSSAPNKRRKSMANPFIHVELNTTDVNKAKTFYGNLFNWELQDMPMPGGSYTMINVGEGTGGGIMKHPVPGAPSAWLAYVLVDDIAAATQKAKSLGATVMKDVTEVMDAGWLSIIMDPTGAVLGLWKPKKA